MHANTNQWKWMSFEHCSMSIQLRELNQPAISHTQWRQINLRTAPVAASYFDQITANCHQNLASFPSYDFFARIRDLTTCRSCHCFVLRAEQNSGQTSAIFLITLTISLNDNPIRIVLACSPITLKQFARANSTCHRPARAKCLFKTHSAVNVSNFSAMFTTLKENILSESNSYYAEQRIF